MNAKLTPQIQAQPEESKYSAGVLELFPRLTRATFLTLFGEEAPPYDPARRIQRWFDSSADTSAGLDAPYKFERYVMGKEGYELKTFSIPVREALTPNLPGAYSYPKYQIPPSGVFYPLVDENGKAWGKNYVPEQSLATEAATIALVTELKQDLIFVGSYRVRPDDLYTSYQAEPGENRRVYELDIAGKWVNVGLLLQTRNAQGVGSPGKWTLQNGDLVWTSQIPPANFFDPRPEIPMPQRRLLPGEEWKISAFGDYLVRTLPDAPPEIGDTPKMFAEILKRLTQIQRDIASKR